MQSHSQPYHALFLIQTASPAPCLQGRQQKRQFWRGVSTHRPPFYNPLMIKDQQALCGSHGYLR